MAEPVTLFTLGLLSARVLAGITCFGLGLSNDEITGSAPKFIKKLGEETFNSIVDKFTDKWLNDAKNIKSFYKQITEIDVNSLNYDLQRAAMKAHLIATLFACEACLQELNDSSTKVGKIKNRIWKNNDTKWLIEVKRSIERQLKELPNISPQSSIDYEEAYRIFDPILQRSSDKQQEKFIKITKEAVLSEIRTQSYKNFVGYIEDSELGFALLSEKIMHGWNDFELNNDFIVQLKLSDNNLPDEKKDKDRWFWLVCNFFNEEYQTNERLKAAMLKNLLLDNKRCLGKLTISVGKLDASLQKVKTGQENIIDLIQKIKLEVDREPFYKKYLGLIAKERVENIIKSKIVDSTFVGRKVEFDKIEHFIRENKSGYFIITAKAGYGKSAFLAKWIDQRLYENKINYSQRVFLAYHFFSREFTDTKTLESGFTNLLRQICIYRAEDFPAETNRMRDTIAGIIKEKQPSENEPLIIVIDALDEADGEIDPFTFDLPEGVYIIISARADKEETPTYLKNWKNLIKTDGSNSLFLGEIEISDVKKWLSIGKLTKYRLDKDEETIDLIYRKTQGLTLYLRYLIEDIIENLEKTDSKEQIKSNLENTPNGFGKYIQKQFNELCESLSNDWQEEVYSLFGIMSVSLSALSEYDVKKLTSLKSTEIRGLPSKARRWIRISEGEDENRSFSFDHDLIRDVFKKEIFQDEKEEFLKNLLVYCSEWRQHNKSIYALQNYPEHLLQAKFFGQLYELARDDLFLESQTKAFPNQPTIALQTLQISLRGAMEVDNAPAIADFVLRHTHRVLNQTIESPLTALRISVLRALSQAELIFLKDIERGVLWYLLLAMVLSHKHNTQKAHAILSKLKNRQLSRFTFEIVEELANITFIKLLEINEEAVIAIQKDVLTDSGRARLVRSILNDHQSQLSITKRLEIVTQLAKMISNPLFSGFALYTIATTYGYFSNFKQALEIVKLIPSKDGQIYALNYIGRVQASEGNIEQANKMLVESLKIAKLISDKILRAEALSSVAVEQARIENFDQANEIFTEALKTAKSISKKFYRIKALSSIAIGLAETGNLKHTNEIFTQELKLAKSISDKLEYAIAIDSIANAQANAGAFEKAVELTESVSDSWTRLSAIKPILDAQAKSADVEKANKLFDRAIKIAESTHELMSRQELLSAIAVAQVNKGDLKQALKTAKLATEEWGNSEVLISIATAEANLGHLEKALEVAMTIPYGWNNWRRAQAIKPALVALINTGDIDKASETFAEALKTDETHFDELNRLTALSSIAIEQAKLGNMNEADEIIADALKIAESITDESERDRALSSIAHAYANKGDFEKANKIAGGIVYEGSLIDALNSIAIAQSKFGDINSAAKIFAKAFEIAKSNSAQSNRQSELSSIAVAQAKIGNINKANEIFAEALKFIDKAGSFNHGSSLRSIGVAQIQAGFFDQAKNSFTTALKTEYATQFKGIHALILSAEAGLQAKLGNVDKADEIFAEALKIAQSLADEWDRSQTLSSLARAYPIPGNFEQALKIAESALINKNSILPEIASVFAEEGSKAYFKQLVIPTSYYLDAAYEMIGMLARVYPTQSNEIKEILKGKFQ